MRTRRQAIAHEELLRQQARRNRIIDAIGLTVVITVLLLDAYLFMGGL